MTAIVIDSQFIADSYLEWVRAQRAGFSFAPRLSVLLYRPAADPASIQYRDLILKDARRLGLEAESVEAADEDDLRRKIEAANANPGIHGLAVFYPLRCSLKDEDVMDLVSPTKDCEGLHSINLGYLIKYKRFLDETRGVKCVVPATPKAVVKSLQHYPSVGIEGAFVAIVNHSMRVGKPLGLMLENLGATVVKCYHKTRPADLEACVRRADIVVCAVPDPSFRLDPAWIKPKAAVLDLSHSGNIDTDALRDRASLITSPDNRLGKVTRAMMFVNLIYCARSANLL